MNFKKIKSVAIYYFSGTGNSFYVSSLYKHFFLLKGILVTMIPIEDLQFVSGQGSYDMLVVSFPVHLFKPPKLVSNFVENLPLTTTHKPILLLSSYADDSGHCFYSLIKVLERKGYHVSSTFKYLMPSNVDFMFSEDLIPENQIKHLISSVKEKVEADFNNLYAGNEIIIKEVFFKRFFYKIRLLTFMHYLKNNKWVVSTDKCTFCEICSKNCPTKNITVKKHKKIVRFSDKCIMCTRCYNLCPVNAINFKSKKTENYRRYSFFKKDVIRK